MALLAPDPSPGRLRRQILLNAARRQFPEGDVQHWWLPRTGGAGVRTHVLRRRGVAGPMPAALVCRV
jgi:cyclic beta-1,2-glucan synthetase